MPRRRCAGCGRVAPKSELVRLAVARDGQTGAAEIVFDCAGRMQGRGAYLCRAAGAPRPVPACLLSGIRRGGIARTLRSRVAIAPELVESTDGG